MESAKTTQNEPKQVKTIQNDPKQAKTRPFPEESCTRVPERSRNFVCASDRSGKDSQALFIPWKSKPQ